jgi:hypothetical protein
MAAFNLGAALNGLTSFVTSATSAGLSATQISSLTGSLFGGVKSTVQPMLAAIISNATDVKLVADQAEKIKLVAGLPAGIAAILDDVVATAGDLAKMMPYITQIETLLG